MNIYSPRPITRAIRHSVANPPSALTGQGESWVIHAAPDWSNARRDMPRDKVAVELLEAFRQATGAPPALDQSNVLYCEAHRWNNAYPLNPRPPAPIDEALELGGYFATEAALPGLVSCGDWCNGPRAADAYLSGFEAAQMVMNSLA